MTNIFRILSYGRAHRKPQGFSVGMNGSNNSEEIISVRGSSAKSANQEEKKLKKE